MSKTPIFKTAVLTKIERDIEHFLNENVLTLKGYTAPLILKHIKVLKEIMFLYLYDERVFSVAYSGGKDSTATLDLVLKALMLIRDIYGSKKLSKKTFVLFSDTYMELDPVINGILQSLSSVQAFTDLNNLNVVVEKVSPEIKDRFFSLIIGKGYILPSSNTRRYCTERLKILPQTKAINRLLKNEGKFIAITGQRQDESHDRKKRMESHTIDGSFKSHDIKGCSLYAPVEYFTSENIWDYIYTASFDWVDANELGRIYAEASDDGDECISLLYGDEGMTPKCSRSSRFGCWICPLHVNRDKTLSSLTKHYPYLKEMELFRNWIVKDAEGQWNWKRDVFIHGKHKMKRYDIDNHRKGMWLPGGYSLYFRAQMLNRLIELEKKVYPERGKYLISDEELTYIQEIWIEDGDVSMTAQRICDHRKIEISEKHKKAVNSACIMKDISPTCKNPKGDFYLGDWITIEGLNENTCARYFTQAALQIEELGEDSKLIFEGLRYGESNIRKILVDFIKTLPVEIKMDFLSNSEERAVREEWKNDKLSFITFLEKYKNNEIKKPQRTLFGYEGDYGTHFEALELLENGTDIIDIDNELISVHDKMKWFD